MKNRSILQTMLLTLMLCVCLPAGLFAQQISLRITQGTVQQAMETLQKQYNYSFVLQPSDVELSRPVTLDVRDQDITEVLALIFEGQNVEFTVENKQIRISRRTAPVSGTGGPQSAVTVTGTVTDMHGSPVAGAAVMITETRTGVVTDANGKYSIVASPDHTLQVSFLGYKTELVKIATRMVVDFTLREDTALIDEVIVVGYGTQRKSDLTGAITQVRMEAMENKQAISLADYLRGSVAGLNIQRSSSVSGQSSFQIRGQTSLGTNTDPLLVVDGIIFQGLLNDINPNDIETVSVMKDASSAAVYGASAAAGVIIITTKQGKSEKPTIRFDVKTSVSKLHRREKAYGVDDYLQMRADKLITDKVPHYNLPEYFSNPYHLKDTDLAGWLEYDAGINPASDPTEVWLNRLKLYPEEKENYYNHESVDWVDRVFRTGIVQDYNLSVSGKTEKMNYYWSLGMLENKGIVENSAYKNIRSRVNMINDVTDFLQVGIRANLSSANSDGREADWSAAYENSPLGTLRNEDGTYTRYPNSDIIAKNPFDKTQWDVRNCNLNLIGSVFAKVRLPLGVELETNYNNRWRFRQGYTYKPSTTIDGMRPGGDAERVEYKQYDWSLENILRWNGMFADIHRLDVTILQSASQWNSWSTTASGSQFMVSELLGYHLLDAADVYGASSEDLVETKASYMARVNYALLDKYLLTVSFRRDGYSAFGQDNPWADFPAAAVAWRISEEGFMQGISWLDNLKLRLSYGKNGNSAIGRYAALASLASGNYINDGSSVVTLYPVTMGNKRLKWEETLASNIGLDLSVLNNRLNLTAEFYKMKTTDMLVQRKLPTLTGFTSVASNLGRVDNKGIELTLSSLNLNKQNLRWSSDFTFSMNRNKIVHLYGDMVDVVDAEGKVIGQREADDPSNGWYIGHSIDEIYGYKIIGVWQTDEAEEALRQGRVPGDYKTFMREDSQSLSSADYLWQGHKMPRYRMSLRNSLTLFGSIDLSFMLRSELGHKKNSNEINTGSYADRVSQIKYPYWTEENPSDYWGRLGASRTGTLYRNASFLRIEDITLSYSLPQKWISQAALQSARIFFNVDNVRSFDSWRYWDVETKAPLPTTYTFGLNLTF